jgi:L-asparagine transporter-like permease
MVRLLAISPTPRLLLTRSPVQICLGEMVAHLPVPGGHITLARRFVSPAFGFALGWKYVDFSLLSRLVDAEY